MLMFETVLATIRVCIGYLHCCELASYRSRRNVLHNACVLEPLAVETGFMNNLSDSRKLCNYGYLSVSRSTTLHFYSFINAN
jgi:hypothetical protein